MKRVIAFLMCVFLMSSLWACASRKEELKDPVNFYYLKVQLPDEIYHGTAESVITPELREGYEIKNDISKLISRYFNGPITDLCHTPFPSGTKLVSWSIDGTALFLTLSDPFAQLSGMDLTLACACLTKTCLGFGDFDTVSIQTETQMLDGKSAVIMSEDSLLMLDETVTDSESENN